MPRQPMQVIAVGLLLVTLPTLINDWVHIPDFARGFLLGLGIVIEIYGIVIMRRKKNADPECIE